jgi:hypothetical protein
MKLFPFVLITLAVLLNGCSSMLETDYRMESPHSETPPETLPGNVFQMVATYADLKNAILRTVRAGNAESTVRLHNYVGDVESDIQRATYTVSRVEPIGVYALDFLSYKPPAPLLTDYDIQLLMYYRRTAEQIKAVEFISGPTDFRERFKELLTGFGTELAVETNYYQESAYDIEAVMYDLYYENPLYAQGIPELSKNLYPDSGLSRVIEMNLYYPDTLDALRARVRQCEEAVLTMTSLMPDGLDAPRQALWLYETLAGACDFDSELYQAAAGDVKVSVTVYDALCAGRALPEAYALAYKALCDDAGLNCRVVRGSRSRLDTAPREHFWNLVELEGNWYHIDLSADMMNDGLTYRTFLVDDSLMSLEYIWDTASVPSADGTLTYDGLIEEGDMA